jgi:autotransporter family porin
MVSHRVTTWRVGILLSVWSIIFFTPSTPAQVNSWTNNIGGKWETPGAWSLDAVPSDNQSYTFITNGFFTGFSLKDVVIDSNTVASAPGSLNINDLVISAPIVHGIGPAHQGFNVLIISNATLTVQNTLALSTGGALTVTNAELDFPGNTQTVDLLAGDGSVVLQSGTFNVANNLFGTYGTVTEAIGVNLSGTLTVEEGLDMIWAGGLAVGQNPGSTGTVWLTGGGTISVEGDTFLGMSGTGSLIQSNGTFYSYGEFVGNDAQGTLTVAGGFHYVDADGLGVGYGGTGTGSVWVTGGVIEELNGITEITLGSLSQSNGLMELLGIVDSGTVTLAGGLAFIGDDGMKIEGGAFWVTGGELTANNLNSFTQINTGSLVQSNGSVETFGEIVGADSGVGTLTVADGTHQVGFGGLTIGQGSVSTGTVWITGGDLSATVLFSDISVGGTNGAGSLILSNGSVEADSEIVGGASGAQGTLTIAGGTSTVASDLTIGTPDCTGTGMVIVTGGSLFVTNADHDAVLDLENGKLLLTGGTLVVDQRISTNPCGVFQRTGGTLVIGGVTNALGSFQITSIVVEGTNVLITWTDNAGQTNVVQATNGTGGNYATNFTDLSSPIILTGSGNVTTNYLDVGGATNSPSRFYRVRVGP